MRLGQPLRAHFLTGAVAGLGEEYFAEHQFEYGLFGYLETVAEQATPFIVVNYYLID